MYDIIFETKTFNSTVALQVGFLKHLGDVATVLLDLVCLSLFCAFQRDWMMMMMMMRSDLFVENWLLSDTLCKQQSHWIITINGQMNVCKCKMIFPTDTLQQKIDITDLKLFLAGENTSVLIMLATTVYIYIYIIVSLWESLENPLLLWCWTAMMYICISLLMKHHWHHYNL